MATPRLDPARRAPAAAVLLLLAACASAPAPEPGIPDPGAALDLASFHALDAERATCVAGELLREAQQVARRSGRSMNASPQALAERDAWFARRVEANRMHQLMQAIRVTASSSPSSQQWAQQVLANSVYFNPGDTRMQLWTGVRIGPTARQYEDLVAGGPERRMVMSQDAEGFRVLADTHAEALAALEAAQGDAGDPALNRVAERLAAQVRRNPALEVVYQEEFTLEYNYGSACGPAPVRIEGMADLGEG